MSGTQGDRPSRGLVSARKRIEPPHMPMHSSIRNGRRSECHHAYHRGDDLHRLTDTAALTFEFKRLEGGKLKELLGVAGDDLA